MIRLKRLTLVLSIFACMLMTPYFLWAQPTATVEPIKPKVRVPGKATSTGNVIYKRPDLQVGVIKVIPHNPAEGKQVTFEGNVMNYGEGKAKNPVVTLTVTGPAGTSFPVFRQQFNLTLNKSQGVTFVKKFIATKPGSYTCKFSLDPARMITETNDNNNVKQLTFQAYPLPDLIVCVSNGKRPPVGGRREIKAVVKNIGNGHCNDYIKLQLYVEGKGTKTFNLLPISAGNYREVTRSAKWSTSGTKTIKAKIIYTKKEINKNNNEATGSYFVRLPHHDKYGYGPALKCSNNPPFNTWDDLYK